MDLLESLQQSIIQEAYRMPSNRKRFGPVPSELVVPEGEDVDADVKIQTPNAPKLVAPLVKEAGFRPTFDLDEGTTEPAAVFVGQVGGTYKELRLLWMPETTAGPGEFLPQEAFQIEDGMRHGSEWLAGESVGA